MFELGIVGSRNSGKTTLIEALVKDLAAVGYRVATIKHTSHDHTFDTPGKDSFRHRAAGAVLTLVESSRELALFGQPEYVKTIARKIMSAEFDLCLVEGDRRSSRSVILITRLSDQLAGDLPSNIVASYGPPLEPTSPNHFAPDNLDGLLAFVREYARQNTPEKNG